MILGRYLAFEYLEDPEGICKGYKYIDYRATVTPYSNSVLALAKSLRRVHGL